MKQLIDVNKSDSKCIITTNPYNDKQLLTFIVEGGQFVQINAEQLDQSCDNRKNTNRSIDQIKIGQVYLGKVQKIVPNIEAAFVEIWPGLCAFLSYEDMIEGKVKQGEEILVQITKEAMGMKQPTCSMKISICSQHCIASMEEKNGFFFSRKLSKEVTSSLKEYFESKMDNQSDYKNFSFVLRTNCTESSKEDLWLEIETLLNKLNEIKTKGKTRMCFSLILDSEPSFISTIKDLLHRNNDKIDVISDQEDVICYIKDNLTKNETDKMNLQYYTDSFSLVNLYSLKTQLDMALQKRVWLKSGGFLVIEPTEALVAIDVNSGKYIGNKSKEEMYYLTNQEAAYEIARQLRLRNLSGMIIIDFINMENKEHQQDFIKILKEVFAHDPIQTNVIDITKLGLVEVTRKKIGKPLHEIL